MNSIGQRKLQPNAVPIVDVLNDSKHNYTMASPDVKVCRICLATDCKLYPMTEDKTLCKAYETLTGLLMQNEINLPTYMCSECSSQLLYWARFRTKSLQSHLILLEIMKKYDCITLEAIQSSTGDQIPFSSNLSDTGMAQYNIHVEFPEEGNINTNNQTDMRNLYDYENKPIHNIKVEYVDEINCLGNVDTNVEFIKLENDDVSHQEIFYEDSTAAFIKMENDVINEDAVDEDTTDDKMCLSILQDDIVIDTVKIENNDLRNHVNEEFTCFNKFNGEDYSSGSSHAFGQAIQRGKRKLSDLYHTKPVTQRSLTSGQLANEEFSCDICSYKTFKVVSFFSHLKAHAANMSYNCKECNYRTISKDNIESHIRTHTGEKPFSCTVCNRAFNRKSDLYQHKGIHIGKKPYTCDICNDTFRRKRYLQIHMTLHFGKGFSCDVCKKTFNRKDNLQMHTRIHSGEKPYSCNICNLKFSRNDNLRKHLRMHNDEKPFPCEICNKAFVTNSDLQKHLRGHIRDKPHSCHICSKRFVSNSILQRHLKTHTGEKPYSCDVCNKAYSRNADLQKHLRTHAIEKSYSCHVCNKMFSKNSLLQRHLRTHIGKQYS